MDILLIDHNLTVAESRQQNYTGMYGYVTMNLTITVFCEGNFSGSDCTQCVSGFTGPDCNETDHCFGVNCNGNGECTPGFSRSLCSSEGKILIFVTLIVYCQLYLLQVNHISMLHWRFSHGKCDQEKL